MNLLTLKLFNAVIKTNKSEPMLIAEHGLLLLEDVATYKDEIIEFYTNSKLSNIQLNKSFYKAWKTIEELTALDRFIDQILHYISTYGTNFTAEIYIPEQVIDIPDDMRKVVVIKALTKDDVIKKCFNILSSKMALKEETINDVINLLLSLNVPLEQIATNTNNKEASIILFDKFHYTPMKAVDIIRFIVFKCSGSTLLIKNDETTQAIAESEFDISKYNFDVATLATIFNRFKPLFVALKHNKAKLNNAPIINKISKLSKKLHVPMTSNPLNEVTVKKLEDIKVLQKATIWHLFKAINALRIRIAHNEFDAYQYQIRNGKSFAHVKKANHGEHLQYNLQVILGEVKSRIYKKHGEKLTVLMDYSIDYALPTSEKAFIGNIPIGTKITPNITSETNALNIGVYWENAFGVRDLDLSSIDMNGRKIGWNAEFINEEITYSGDITDAPKGATEFLRFANKSGAKSSALVCVNAFSRGVGDDNDDGSYRFKIVVGDCNTCDTDNLIMTTENLIVDEMVESNTMENTIGFADLHDGTVDFYIFKSGSGNGVVSSNSEHNANNLNALLHSCRNSLRLTELFSILGYEVITTHADNIDYIDLSVNKLAKDTFINLFNTN